MIDSRGTTETELRALDARIDDLVAELLKLAAAILVINRTKRFIFWENCPLGCHLTTKNLSRRFVWT
uniref:Uncharacterized protein n=1 Tax=viral metagenome TaxID=1070528 RepID=A0A6M3JA73_9ZZZZ